jgi:hypothetical protein
LQPYDRFLAYLLDSEHIGAHIHLLHPWRRWTDQGEVAEAEVPVNKSGRWLHCHFSPYTAREQGWCLYLERWLRVIAKWPMQNSFVESSFRLHEALRRIPKSEPLGPLVVS